MRRYIKNIFLLLVTVLAASCVKELELAPSMSDSELTTLVPRVKSFANHYVTKAGEEEIVQKERKISKLSVLVFDNSNNLVHIAKDIQSTGSVNINKSMLKKHALSSATIVMLANVDLQNVKKTASHSLATEYTYLMDNDSSTPVTLTPADLANYSIHIPAGLSVVTDITSTDFTGFPMIGQVKADLSNSKIEVGLRILYAKVNFEIAVEEGGENQKYDGDDYENAMTFSMNNCKVFNTSLQTSVSYPTEKDQPILDIVGNTTETTAEATSATLANHENASGVEVCGSGVADLGDNANSVANKINFTFYMSENRFNPNSDLTGIYPDDLWISTTDYDDYKQHYKPQVATKKAGTPANMATYVKLNGTYVDYRGTSWNVDYTVYLGKDNYQNFQVDRNSEYTNKITIKGIRNNSSYGDKDRVWIDHRVNVSTTDLSGTISITRETLLDSHIEVRPLRVKIDTSVYSHIRVYPENVDWIGVERFTGFNCQDGSVYCYNNLNESTGKRRYFTTNLITELKRIAGSEGYVPLEDGDCAWVYFDENTPKSGTATVTQRQATITLKFYDKKGEYVSGKDVTYKVIQSAPNLIDNKYYIESYEEYLHSYDSADKYNLSTNPVDYTQQGLIWGLSGKEISERIITSATQWLGVSAYASLLPKYDFFHVLDDPKNTYHWYASDKSWEALSKDEKAIKQTGLYFTELASDICNIKVKDMGTLPDNAYQYCLSKNKFTEDASGNVSMDVHWYLPDVYEIQTMLNNPDNSTSKDILNPDTYYWSSQPSYSGFDSDDVYEAIGFNLGFDVSLKQDDTENARAASASKIEDQSRSNVKNRIRCFYSTTGVTTNMTDRTPDGIGGNHTFYMRAWETWQGKVGYFSALPADTLVTGGTPYTLAEDYDFPKDADDTDQYFGSYVAVDNGEYGFQENPMDSNNQDTERVSTYTSYVALYTWPGLTMSRVVPKETPLSNQTYYALEGTKQETKSVDSTWCTKYERDILKDTLLKPMLLANPNINISFGKGHNGTYKPTYSYKRVNKFKSISATRTWQLPQYETVYKTDWAEQDPIYTPGGTVQLTSSEQKNMNRVGGSAATNNDGYIYPNADAAKTAGEACVLPNGARRISVESETGLNIHIYTALGVKIKQTRYRYKIRYELPGQPVPHFKYSGKGGEWAEKSNGTTQTQTSEATGPEIDELRLYSGNSFTISTSSPNYIITKVKVYIKGGNRFSSENLGSKEIFGRFVDDILVPTNGGEIASDNISFTLDNSDPIKLQGMTYSSDATSGEIWQEWTGADTEVKLSLADYIVEDYSFLGATIYTKYTYTCPQSTSSHNVVIDRIEVKCVPK